jgi:hypothetical protein
VWFALLLYLILSSVSILWFLRAAYRRIYPQRKSWPRLQLMTIALSPFAAIRTNDFLAAELLSEFHPVAVADRLLVKQDFLQFAGSELRKARFLHCDEFLARFLEAFLVQKRFDPEFLLQAPSRESPSSPTYCPVCLTEYVIDSGVCQHCDGTPLVAFPSCADACTRAEP